MKLENKSYYSDKIRAIDAKIEAIKISFSPMTFQAVRALIELGLLQKISDAKDEGITVKELSEKSGISEYGVGVLCEMALGMGVVKIKNVISTVVSKTSEMEKSKPRDFNRCDTSSQQGDSSAEQCDNSEERDDSHLENSDKSSLGHLVLGKIGWFLLEDDLTKVNFNFANDICYKGAFNLIDSVKNGKPEGLKIFGDKWTTVYEALSTLPEREKKSWFDFDHFYSDVAFPEALPIVYAKKPKNLFDIGGNTAKWAIASCKYDKDVHVTIIDLPGQTAVAEKNAKNAGFSDRISFVSGNVLDNETKLPAGANAVWMSQFLDCFSLHQITKILTKIYNSVDENCDIFVMEPLWDMQKFEGESYALQATSLYFTCIANGNSKMYRYGELVEAIEKAGFHLVTAHHNLGSNFYSILNFRKN